MRGSIKLFKVADISINIHVTFFLLLLLFLSMGVKWLLLIVAIFCFVTLHELAHSIFHSWGIQTIITSRPPVNDAEIAQKKKEFLDTKDKKAKERLLNQLVSLRREEREYTDMAAAQSWLAEGTATFCETIPVGSTNEEYLYLFQEMEAG